MKTLISLVSAVALFALSTSANADGSSTIVATISGCYDCIYYDTPALIFNNTTGGTLTNAQMVLTGYQAINNGISATVNLGSLGAGSTQFYWGDLPGVSSSTTPGNMTAYDYDDQYLGTSHILPNSGATANCGGTCVTGGGPQWYADVGNFNVTFTATVLGGQYNGDAVYSVFSPTNNATGSFVPWEGLNANGYSEQPCCDIHSGTITGDLANIALGTPPTGVPEIDPASAASALTLLLGGIVVLRGRKRISTAA
jgi:hypothetical protein